MNLQNYPMNVECFGLTFEAKIVGTMTPQSYPSNVECFGLAFYTDYLKNLNSPLA